eukprot:Partr_v1_DN27293_c0_g1_i1_m38677 putative SPOC domain containing 1
MICCENCSNWFHGRCVKVTKAMSRNIKDWLCVNCAALPAEEVPVKQRQLAQAAADPKPTTTTTSRRLASRASLGRARDEATPLKKSKSSSSRPAAPSQTPLDQVRQRVVQNFQKVLETGRIALIDLNKQAASTDTAVGEDSGNQQPYDLPSDVDINQLAVDIESAMNDSLSGDQYKEKFRTLHFNLKDAKNAFNVLSGHISPARLVTMSSEDLANEQLKSMKQEVQKESLRGSVLTEDMVTVILKKTHKGEVAVAPKKGDKVESADAVSSIIGASGVTPLPQTSADVSAESTPEVSSKLLASTVEAVVMPPVLPRKLSESSQITPAHSVPTSPRTQKRRESEKPKVADNSLDALLAKMQSDQPGFRPTSAVPENVPAQQFVPNENFPSQLNASMFEDDPVVWGGKIDMPGVSAFNGILKLIGGTPHEHNHNWKELLPPIIDIDGRISPSAVKKYLDEQVYSSGRAFEILAVEIQDEQEHEGYGKIWQYFTSRSRYAVVKSPLARVRDMYLVPITRTDRLPDFLAALEHNIPLLDRAADVLIAFIVYTPFSQPVNTVAQPAPIEAPVAPPAVSQPDPVPVANVDHALSLLNTIVPQFSPTLAPEFSPTNGAQISPFPFNGAQFMHQQQAFPGQQMMGFAPPMISPQQGFMMGQPFGFQQPQQQPQQQPLPPQRDQFNSRDNNDRRDSSSRRDSYRGNGGRKRSSYGKGRH